MTISWFQAALLGLFACLSSMPGLGELRLVTIPWDVPWLVAWSVV